METEKKEIQEILLLWAERTRKGQQDLILEHHDKDVVIFDVLPPMKYEGTKSYKDSWDEWQPNTQGEAIFNLENLTIFAEEEIGFAFGFIRCGGVLQNGESFEDLVRATFCLKKKEGTWSIIHQHISSPRQ